MNNARGVFLLSSVSSSPSDLGISKSSTSYKKTGTGSNGFNETNNSSTYFYLPKLAYLNLPKFTFVHVDMASKPKCEVKGSYS